MFYYVKGYIDDTVVSTKYRSYTPMLCLEMRHLRMRAVWSMMTIYTYENT